MVNADRLNVSYTASLICLGYIGLIVHEMWDARDARHPKIWWVTIQSNTQHVRVSWQETVTEILTKESSKRKNTT